MKWNLKLVMVALAAPLIWTAPAADKPSAETIALYGKNCASCHAKDGSGNTRMGKRAGAKDYRDPKVQAAMKDDVAFKAIKEGMKENGKLLMKPYGDKINDEEIKALIAYMRTFVNQ